MSVSRNAWALARDVSTVLLNRYIHLEGRYLNQVQQKNALPFSPYFAQISPTHNMPVRTTLLSVSFFIIFGLLYIASSKAFNSFVNMAALLVNIAYTVPQGILACRRRDRLSPTRVFNLGKSGYVVNAFSVCWLILVGVLFCFPVSIPTSGGGMN